MKEWYKEPYFSHRDWILANASSLSLGTDELLVCLYIDFANEKGILIDQSILAEKLGLKVEKVNKALKSLVAQLDDNYIGDVNLPLGIADADCPQDAETLEHMVREWFDAHGLTCPPIVHLTVDATIGSHVGPGMVALAFWGADRTAGWKSSGKR